MTIKERARRMMEAVDAVVSVPSYLEEFLLPAIEEELRRQDEECGRSEGK